MAKKNCTPPRWVNWIAQDANGNWWGYSIEPQPHDHGWYENEVGDCVLLSSSSHSPAWRQTLRRIDPTKRGEPMIIFDA